MFEAYYWTGIINAVSRLPKEVVVGVTAAFVVIHIHDRNCDMKVDVAKAEARKAEAEVEKLKLEKQS